MILRLGLAAESLMAALDCFFVMGALTSPLFDGIRGNKKEDNKIVIIINILMPNEGSVLFEFVYGFTALSLKGFEVFWWRRILTNRLMAKYVYLCFKSDSDRVSAGLKWALICHADHAKRLLRWQLALEFARHSTTTISIFSLALFLDV